MSRSMIHATFALLVAAGLLVPVAQAQQRFKPIPHGGSPKAWQQKSVTASPKNLQLTAPKLPNNWQPELRPPAFGRPKVYIPPAQIPNYVPAPIASNNRQLSGSPVPEKYGVVRLPRVDGKHYRPQAPGQQPAGNPWIARSNQRHHQIASTRFDPQVKGLAAADGRLPDRVPGARALPASPPGNAAPAIGNRGLAADLPAPGLAEQRRIYNDNLMRSFRPGSTSTVDEQGGLTQFESDGTGFVRQFWNERGELQDDTTQFGTDQNGTTTVTHTSVRPDGRGNLLRTRDTKTVEGPIASWSHTPTHQISRGPSSGELKGPPEKGSHTGSYGSTPLRSKNENSPPKSGDDKNNGGNNSGGNPADKGSPPQNEPPVKETGTDGGPKKHSSSPGVEGGGTGVDGRSGDALRQREDTGEIHRSVQPDSVTQPVGPDPTSSGAARRFPKIQASDLRRGGYIPTTPQRQQGQGLAAQPAQQEAERRGAEVNNRPFVERLQEATINPGDR